MVINWFVDEAALEGLIIEMSSETSFQRGCVMHDWNLVDLNRLSSPYACSLHHLRFWSPTSFCLSWVWDGWSTVSGAGSVAVSGLADRRVSPALS